MARKLSGRHVAHKLRLSRVFLLREPCVGPGRRTIRHLVRERALAKPYRDPDNPRHESRHLECEWHPGACLPGPRVARARATGRGVSPGTEGRSGADPGRMQAPRVSRVLARP